MQSRIGRGAEPVPCVQCDRREPGLAWGEFCSTCRENQERGATRIARWAALLGAAFLGLLLLLEGLADYKTRLFGAASVLLMYVILRRLVWRGVVEYRRRRDMDSVRRRQR
jgi:hypothetical protein